MPSLAKQLTMASSSSLFLLVALLALASWQATAYDPSPLQDFCIADMKAPVRVNGFACKDPMAATPEDFFNAAMLDQPRDTKGSKVRSNVTNINVINFPGLNTLGISLARTMLRCLKAPVFVSMTCGPNKWLAHMSVTQRQVPLRHRSSVPLARIDYGPLGVNTPHIHPRATELLTVLEGTLYLGFVTSNPNRLFSKIVKKGDVLVFPKAMIHFQMNLAHDKPAAALSSLSSQNPGVISIANAVFGSKPPISDDVLATAFQVEKDLIHWLQSQFWENNNY